MDGCFPGPLHATGEIMFIVGVFESSRYTGVLVEVEVMERENLPYSWYPSELTDFCNPHTERLAFLARCVERRKLKYSIVSISGSRHLVIRFDEGAYDGAFCVKNLVAHYDRSAAAPGANDNGAAVFQLLDFASRLSEEGGRHNIQIIFTDNEELSSSDRVESQGSYMLAQAVKRIRPSDVFFVFDVCGSGDTLILSTVARNSSPSRPVPEGIRRTQSLHVLLEETLAAELAGGYFRMEIPFSDNLGILKAGLPAAAFTVLPREEALRYAGELKRSPAFRRALIANLSDMDDGPLSSPDSRAGKPAAHASRASRAGKLNAPVSLSESYPETWRRLHTPFDTVAMLNPEAFRLMARLFSVLAQLRLPVAF
jgi:hypothetical protein